MWGIIPAAASLLGGIMQQKGGDEASSGKLSTGIGILNHRRGINTTLDKQQVQLIEQHQQAEWLELRPSKQGLRMLYQD